MPASQHGCQRFGPEVLLEVAERLAEPTASLTLHVCDGLRERVFYFVSGGVRLLARGEGAKQGIVSYLLTRCLVDAETLQELIAEADARNKGLRDLLHDKGILSREELNQLVNRLIRDELLALVFWRDSFCITSGEAPPKEIYSSQRQVLAGQFDCRQLAREVKEWIQLWSRSKPVLGSDASIITVADAAKAKAGEGLPPNLAKYLGWCSNGVELRELWRDSGRELPVLCAELVELAGRGLIAIKAPASSSSDIKKDLEHRIERIEANLDGFLEPKLVREKLVQCFRSAGQTHKAVNELHVLAQAYLEEQNWLAAVERFKEILQLEAANLEAHERLFAVLVKNGQEKRAVAHATAAARGFLAGGEWEEAVQLGRLLASTESARTEGLAIQAEALAGSGESRHAAERHVTLAQELAAAGDAARAREHLEAAARLDPGRAAAAGELRSPAQTGAAADGTSDAARAAAAAAQGPAPAPREGWLGRRRRRALVSAAVFVGTAVFGGALVAICAGWTERAVEAVGSSTGPAAPQQRAEVPSPAPAGAVVVKRVVDERWAAVYGRSRPFKLENRWTEREVVRFAGREDAAWAVGWRARRVCLWEPGKPALVYSPPDETPLELSWSLPADVVAAAVGDDVLALCRGPRTHFYSFDGRLAGGGELAPWTEGLFVEDVLVVQSGPQRPGGSFEIRAVSRRDARVVWTATAAFGALGIY